MQDEETTPKYNSNNNPAKPNDKKMSNIGQKNKPSSKFLQPEKIKTRLHELFYNNAFYFFGFVLVFTIIAANYILNLRLELQSVTIENSDLRLEVSTLESKNNELLDLLCDNQATAPECKNKQLTDQEIAMHNALAFVNKAKAIVERWRLYHENEIKYASDRGKLHRYASEIIEQNISADENVQLSHAWKIYVSYNLAYLHLIKANFDIEKNAINELNNAESIIQESIHPSLSQITRQDEKDWLELMEVNQNTLLLSAFISSLKVQKDLCQNKSYLSEAVKHVKQLGDKKTIKNSGFSTDSFISPIYQFIHEDKKFHEICSRQIK